VRRAGRRPGTTETRDQIVTAARRIFAERGYDGATVRAIASAAGVNPALVHHFFGTKQNLFVAAIDFPLEPAVVVQIIASGARDEVGERIVRVFLSAWGDPVTQASLLAVVRSVVTNEQAAAMFRQFAEAAFVGRLSAALKVPRTRLMAAIAQMIGLAIVRYVVRVEPIASAEDEEIVRLIAPMVQRYIDGP
jgi:AcrR family transcriptional regulator